MSARLELALDLLAPEDWRRFEKFASEFLVYDFPGLKDMSARSGDGGRDAEEFSLTDDPTQLFQYSVTANWEQKIRETVKRINQTNPSAQVLIYASPKRIGAEADAIKREVRRDYRIHLDIRDKSYFTVRHATSQATHIASEALAADIVDRILSSRDGWSARKSDLTTSETHAAHIFLMLQLKDDTGEKGLTKLSFEAIIRSVLVRTNANSRISRTALLTAVKQLMPQQLSARVEELANASITRLAKRQIIKLYPKDETICLSHEESIKVLEYLATCELDELALSEEIRKSVASALADSPAAEQEIVATSARARRILERCLYSRAETFATAVLNGRVSDFALDHLGDIVLQDLNKVPAKKGSKDGNPEVLTHSVKRVLGNTSTHVYQYLKGLADAYTLMAFLSSTPDVQSAVQKIFSHGEIWLDTTIILPMLAEELLDENMGRIQSVLSLTRQAGIDLYTTNGVLDELSTHIKRAITYTRLPGHLWEGGIPFIFEAFVRAGRDPNDFGAWIETLMGDARPSADLGSYIEERFGIKTQDLHKEVSEADAQVRNALDVIWNGFHEARRAQIKQRENGRALDPLTVLRLAKHDTESYLGVVQRRKEEATSPLGYKCWWLTFDTFALRVGDALKRQGITPPSSPVMSIDFLSQYLSLGPVRGKMSKSAIRELPLVIEPRLVAFLTPELLEQAKKIRLSSVGLPERVVARRVRDHLDSERRRMGPLAERGTETFFDEVSDLALQN